MSVRTELWGYSPGFSGFGSGSGSGFGSGFGSGAGDSCAMLRGVDNLMIELTMFKPTTTAMAIKIFFIRFHLRQIFSVTRTLTTENHEQAQCQLRFRDAAAQHP
jgi:hypothetical protein